MAAPSDPQALLAGVSSIATDSRAVTPGALFVALRGQQVDGHRFIDDAVARGAVAVISEEPIELAGVRVHVVPNSAIALSALAADFYARPAERMTMIGVTGTNGKTTTTHMIAAILNHAGRRSAVIGTLGARFEGEAFKLENTTPLALDLHRLLAELYDRGAQCVAMEVSSHALALHRVDDIHFEAGVMTNLSRDHLDFHGTLEAYKAAKFSLFERASSAILNADDQTAAEWAELLRKRLAVTTYGVDAQADVRPTNIAMNGHESRFTVDGVAFRVPLPGRFNISNALAAMSVARHFDVSLSVCAEALALLSPVAGRMESLREDGVSVVVDYAHTPDALANALRTLRETQPKRLTVVFGCGGDRDRGKRAQMGEVAARYADRIIVTSDNPRTEDPRSIIAEIEKGLSGASYEVQEDRKSAIYRAVKGAVEGEVVLLAGKGHETYQIVGNRVLEFNDREIAREALAQRGNA